MKEERERCKRRERDARGERDSRGEREKKEERDRQERGGIREVRGEGGRGRGRGERGGFVVGEGSTEVKGTEGWGRIEGM